MDKIDWYILNSLADDWESSATINGSLELNEVFVDLIEVEKRLEKMLNDKWLELMPNNQSKEKWYGMTKLGSQIYEEQKTKFFSE